MRVDVAIAGAGPAGSACAISLCSRFSVALIEASRFDTPRLGETLSPAARPILRHLGVWPEGHAEAHGTAAVWGGPTLHENDYLFLARGPGWHLDRARFDRMLAEEAASRGATLLLGVSVLNVRPRWHLSLSDGSSLEARFLVDATGNASIATRFCGARVIAFDHLISFGRFLEDSSGADPRTIVEAFEDGWWYTAPLPGGRRFVACMTEASIARRLRLHEEASWTRLLSATRVIAPLAGAASGPIVARACGSQRLDPAAGPGWIAAGDAASRFDPLSSVGITKALRSGVFASYALGDPAGIRRYEHFIRTEFDAYLATRAKVYADEQRWQNEFWKGRAGGPPAD